MEKKSFSTKYVDVLDGIRALSVIIVLIFHFWQQTWIFPVVHTPFLSFLGINTIDFTPFAKVGYLFVDMMVLISGFLLFMPVARNVLFGESLSKWKDYYKKRAIRILPSYLFCIIVLFVYELFAGGYGKPIDWGYAVRDMLTHLTFTQTWRIDTYISTRLNVVLWTVAIEVWFYIIFPLFANFIKRRKKEDSSSKGLLRAEITAIVLIVLSLAYIYFYALNSDSAFAQSVDKTLAAMGSGIKSTYLSMTINQLPAFFGTYAIGLIGSFIYVAAASKLEPKAWSGMLFTLLSVGFIYIMIQMLKDCCSLSGADAQEWQLTQRLPLCLVYMGIILSTSFAAKWYRFLFSNPLMRFLSIISYNLYIWHQWLCVKLKNEWKIPAWPKYDLEGAPNTWVGSNYTSEQSAAGQSWRVEYAIVITLFAFAAAILATYLIERPAADLLNGRPSIYNGKLKTLFKKDVNRNTGGKGTAKISSGKPGSGNNKPKKK